MFPKRAFQTSVCASFFALTVLVGCESGKSSSSSETVAPPDARRPQIRSDAELAAERDSRIQRGEIVPADAPVVEAERKRLEAMKAGPAQPPRLEAPANAIQGDILLVNKQAVTVDEVLYALRERIAKARQTKSRNALREELERLLRTQTQQEVGSLLVYEKAVSALEDPQIAALDAAVDREVNTRIAREFEGSVAKFTKHLGDYGMSLAQYKERTKKQLVVRGYTREILMPRITVRRDELFEHYKANREKYSTPGSRELLIVEAPFDQFLPQGVSWSAATRDEQARARLKARRHIQDAAAALSGRPFADVATEFSKGPHREQGGSWGEIGTPLKAPYDRISQPIFAMSTGQSTEPIELESGWYIAGCGRVTLAREIPFAEAQPTIRDDLREERFNKVANEYVLNLASKSTVAALDSFLLTAMKRANGPLYAKTVAEE
jgi:parvulin-like peptidyl-prolyl isomerase